MPVIAVHRFGANGGIPQKIMKASMKCSNCGSEMSNLNMTWGRKQLWFVIPVMILGFLPLIKMSFFKGDIMKDLVVSNVETQMAGKSLEITGLITNSSRNDWSSVSVEAEFFDASGKFLHEESQHLQSDIRGNSKEHFKIEILSGPPQLYALSSRWSKFQADTPIRFKYNDGLLVLVKFPFCNMGCSDFMQFACNENGRLLPALLDCGFFREH